MNYFSVYIYIHVYIYFFLRNFMINVFVVVFWLPGTDVSVYGDIGLNAFFLGFPLWDLVSYNESDSFRLVQAIWIVSILRCIMRGYIKNGSIA